MGRKKRNVDLSSKDWNIIEENIRKYSDEEEVRNALRCQVERLTKRMDELQISQDELCKKIGISQGAMSNYTSGNRLIDSRTLPKIAKALSISIDYLFGYSDVTDISDDEINKRFGLNDKSIFNLETMSNKEDINLLFGHDRDDVDNFFYTLSEYKEELDKLKKNDSDLQKTYQEIFVKNKKLLVLDCMNDLLENNIKNKK